MMLTWVRYVNDEIPVAVLYRVLQWWRLDRYSVAACSDYNTGHIYTDNTVIPAKAR